MSRALRILCLLLVLALLCGCGAGAPEAAPEAPEPVTLWLWEGEPCAAALAALASEYDAGRPERPVSVRVFESENAMGAALNEGRPDLLLCSGERAVALYAQGKLRDAAPGAAFLPALTEIDECVGRAYFPLGAELPLLAVNAALYLASPATDGVGEGALSRVGSLCSLAAAHGMASEQPFFAAGSWAEFFALCLHQAGEPFDGRASSLSRGAHAAALYNMLAEAAYARGLYVGAEDAGELVRRGYVVCALLPSRALASDTEGLMCYPAPVFDGGDALYPAALWGLAVTAAEDEPLDGVEPFLAWLFEPERSAALAADEGLLPPLAIDSEGAEGSPEEALRRAAQSATLVLPDGKAAWREHAADFDQELRAALALLD